MRITRTSTTEVGFSKDEGARVESFGERYRITSVELEHNVFEDGEVLDTVTVKGRRIKKDGADSAASSYPTVVYGPEVDAVVAKVREDIGA